MNTLESLTEKIPEIETRIGYAFLDKSLLTLAFVHRSFVNENREFVPEHNERLEFLGDAVLGLLAADYLYRELPNTPEGDLSHIRARLVEAGSCINYMETLNVDSHVLLGKGEQRNDGRGRESIVADLFEGIMGAIYLDGGLEACRYFFFERFADQIAAILEKPTPNWKAELQDHSQKQFHEPPNYTLIEELGPDHDKKFHIAVMIGDKEVGRGIGPSKKEAQQEAAKNALQSIQSKDT